ncbi:hypothetical protein D3C86_1956420 [compost metagenome]
MISLKSMQNRLPILMVVITGLVRFTQVWLLALKLIKKSWILYCIIIKRAIKNIKRSVMIANISLDLACLKVILPVDFWMPSSMILPENTWK